ncbi:hypothetical protein EDWATA_02695 [Edwardsiella tarda ATCC 23685]|uniref:Uncharacterized protein n=1 Tax=Edwardsiella tarda ATCC 23685 TaxID=500638 RepID=D4F7G0_EDWTA|nr:hypothetical protein EDWATA_02695 [Edwardsiella tarda ATCC 23685]
MAVCIVDIFYIFKKTDKESDTRADNAYLINNRRQENPFLCFLR